MSSTQGNQTLTDIASDLCRECRDIAMWYSSIPKNQLIGAAVVAETASRGHLGCLRAALRASPGQDLCLNGSRRIVPVRRLRGSLLPHEEARAPDIKTLLFAASEKIDRQIIEIDRQINGQQVQESLQRKFSLKDICRRKIKDHLLSLDPHTNLFGGVLRLGLPASLTAYVLYDIALDDDDEHADDSDDLVDDVISNCSLDVAVGSDIDDYSNSDVSDDDVSVDNGGGSEDIDTDSEDNDDNSNNCGLDVAVGNDVDDCTSGGVFDDNDDDDYNHDCSLDVTVGTDYSNRTHDTVFDSDNDDDCDDDEYSLTVASGSDVDGYSNDGDQDIVGGSDEDWEDEDDEDHDDDSSDGNPDVIDSDGYDSGNGSSLVIVSCDDEDDDYNNDGSLAAINSDGYDSGDGSSLDVASSEGDDDNGNGGSLDAVIDSDDDDDNVNLDLDSSDDNDDDDDYSLVVVIDSDDDDDVANVDSLDITSNDDNTDPHRDFLNFDFPLKHLEYLDLRTKELDPHTHLFNRALYMFNQ